MKRQIVMKSERTINETTMYLIANKIRLNGINEMMLLMVKVKREVITFDMFVSILKLLNIDDANLFFKCQCLIKQN